MPQDAFNLRYLCEELDELFKVGRVNRVVMPTENEAILTVYTGAHTEKLYISANPSSPRIGVIETEKESPLTASAFCMLLRKHLLSSEIVSVSLVGFDRIVKIEFVTRGEFSDGEEKTLFIELMGRYSNVILTENGKVLGCNRGINDFDNGVRPIVAGKNYVFPPDNGKLCYFDEKVASAFDAYNGENGSFSDFVFKTLQGFAASTAEEAVYRYEKENGAFRPGDGEKFAAFIKKFVFTSKAPVIRFCGGAAIDASAFPYLTAQGETARYDKLYLAEQEFFKLKEENAVFSRLKERALSVLTAAEKKAKKRLSLVEAKIKDAETMEENRLKGELLTANLYRVKRGEKSVSLENYYDGSTVTVALDERLSPAANAEKYFKKYNKQKRALVALAPQYDGAKEELDYVISLKALAPLAETAEDVYPIISELKENGFIRETEKRRKKPEKTEFKTYVKDGFVIRVGRSNVENDALVKSAGGEDVWLHSKDYPSSHVVVFCDGKSVPQEVLIAAAEICAYFSKARESDKTEIVYVKRKNVKKPSKAKAGFVTYTDFKSLTVKPNPREELKKDK